jgi:WD40 repeat protein
LLQYTLTELFDRREADQITVDDYRHAGGAVGSIGRRAEAVFTGLSAEDQSAAREILLRLVTVDDAGSVARRRVRRSDLAGGESVDRVLDAFGRHRLLVFDRDPTTHGPTAEVAHEALLARWPRLADWVEDAREDLVFAHRLETAVTEWEQSDRDPSYLLSGSRLDRAMEWEERSTVQIIPGARGYVAFCIERRDAERIARQRQRSRITGMLAAAALLATVLASAAWIQRGAAQDAAALADEEAARAQAAAEEATIQATYAQANELILRADRLVDADPELAIHLSLISFDLFFETGGIDGAAATTLRRALAGDRVVDRFVGGQIAAVSADGSEFATAAGSGGIAIWDVASRERLEVIDDVDGQLVDGVAYTANAGELVVSLAEGGPFLVRDRSDHTWSELPGSESAIYARFSPDGRRYGLLVVDPGGSLSVEVWERASGRREYVAEAASVPFDLANDRLAYARFDGGSDRLVIEVVDVATGAAVWDTVTDPVQYLWPAFSPSGNRIVLSSPDGTVTLTDSRSGATEWTQTGIDRSWRPVWVDEEKRVVLGGEAQFTVVDTTTGDVAFEIAAHDGGSTAYDPVPGTSLLVSAGQVDGETLLIDMVTEVPELGFIQAPFVVEDIGTADGILVMTGEGQYATWDVEAGMMLGEAAPGRLFGHLDNPAAVVIEEGSGDHVLVGRRDRAQIYRAPPGAAIVGISTTAELVVLDRPDGPVAIWDLETLSLERTIRNIGQQLVDWGFYLAGTDRLAVFAVDSPASALTPREAGKEEILLQEPGSDGWDTDHPVQDLGEAGDIDPSGRYHARIADDVLEVRDIIRRDLVWRGELVSAGAVAFSTDGRLAYSAAGDGGLVMSIVDATSGDSVGPPVNVSGEAWALAFSPDNTKVAYVGEDDNVLGVVDVETGHELWFRDDLVRLGPPVWLSDSSAFVTGGEAELRLIDAGTGAIVRTVEHGRGGSVGYAAIPGTDLLAVAHPSRYAAGDPFSTLLVDITGALPEVRRFEMPFARSVTSRVAQNGQVMLIHNPLEFALLSTEDGRPLLHHRAEPDDLLVDPAAGFAVASRNGEFVAGFDGERYRVWRTADATPVYAAPADWTVRGVSDDGGMVAAYHPEMGTRVIDTTTGRELHALDAGPLLQLAFFSPDGQFLVTNDGGTGESASGAFTPGFKIWDVSSGEHVNSLDFSNDLYRGLRVDFTSDSERLILGGWTVS